MEIEALTGEVKAQLEHVAIFPASHYVVPKEKMIDKFTILPVAPTFAEAIARIYNDKPFTAAFG